MGLDRPERIVIATRTGQGIALLRRVGPASEKTLDAPGSTCGFSEPRTEKTWQ
jgi:hypothetical protein